LFVMTSPDEVMTMPVPAASARPPAIVTLTSATAAFTLDAIASISKRPEFCDGWAPEDASLCPRASGPVARVDSDPACIAEQPTKPAPATAATMAATPRRARDGRGREKGSAAFVIGELSRTNLRPG
jgi:hypothetical protein